MNAYAVVKVQSGQRLARRALLGLAMLVATQLAQAWDTGTAALTHDASPGAVDQSLSVTDTRAKWNESVGTNVSRPADCPAGYTNEVANCVRPADTRSAPSIAATCPLGYTNTGLTCTRPSDRIEAPSLLATCPTDYVNTGVSCYREPYDYSAPSALANCPTGYTNTGVSCYREAFIYSAPSLLANCPSGYTHTGSSCYRGPDTYSAPSRVANCTRGTNLGLFCSLNGSFTCPSGYFVNSSIGRCYVRCASGYTNTGEFCSRAPSTLSLSQATCPGGYKAGLIAGRCNKVCDAGFTNTGEFCQRDASTQALSSATCPSGYNKGLLDRCYKSCNAGFTNTGEFCHRDAATLALSSASCPSGYFQGLLGRCDKNCPKDYSNIGEACVRLIATRPIEDTTCPSGYFKGAIPGRCNVNCPSGYTNISESCVRASSTLGASSTACLATEEKIVTNGVARCHALPVCPSGYGHFAQRCYVLAQATGLNGSVERTAASTIVHRVTRGGNTHLHIVNQAMDMLRQAALAEPALGALLADMRDPRLRLAWEQGLWDADHGSLADAGRGTHFYNATGRDRMGQPTTAVTFAGATGNRGGCQNARECAREQLRFLAGFRLGGVHPLTGKLVAYHLGLALHYMIDVTQPMRSSGWHAGLVPRNGQAQWELYVPYVQSVLAGNPVWLPFALLPANTAVLRNPDEVLALAARRSGDLAPRLAQALDISSGVGAVTITAFNDVGAYTGFNFYNDPGVDAVTGQALALAYNGTATYLAAIAATYYGAGSQMNCDVDGNGKVNRFDINAIVAARNTPSAGAADPRDADGNGVIDINDARQCALRCTLANCAP